MNTSHNGKNVGQATTKVLVVFVSVEGKKNLIRAAVCPLLLWAPKALQYAVLMVGWLFDTFSSIMGDQNDYCGMHSRL